MRIESSMLFPRRLMAAAGLLMALAGFTQAAPLGPGNPQNGKDYLTLAAPQPVAQDGRIEVIEFFGYYCPHCYAFDPVIASWVKKQGDRIRFRRVHVIFRDAMIAQQNMYVTLESLGKAEALHSRIFDAMHKENRALANDQQVLDFLTKEGIARNQYQEAARQPAVQESMKRALQLQHDYGVDSVPTIAIDGRFVTSPEIVRDSIGDQPEAALHLATIQVVDQLVARVLRERAAAKANAVLGGTKP